MTMMDFMLLAVTGFCLILFIKDFVQNLRLAVKPGYNAVGAGVCAPKQSRLSLAIEDDSDIKIAHAYQPPVDGADRMADEFVRNKENGNIDKAYELGVKLAHAVAMPRGVAMFGYCSDEPQLNILHRRIMLVFTICKVIEVMSPNSIVAQKALRTFYQVLAELSKEIAEAVDDSVAFSLYIYCDRKKAPQAGCIGAVFAKLCDQEDNPLYITYGDELFGYFNRVCSEMILQTSFVK